MKTPIKIVKDFKILCEKNFTTEDGHSVRLLAVEGGNFPKERVGNVVKTVKFIKIGDEFTIIH